MRKASHGRRSPPPGLIPLLNQGEEDWTKYFVTIEETITACKSVGYEILEADRAPDPRFWWLEYAKQDP